MSLLELQLQTGLSSLVNDTLVNINGAAVELRIKEDN